MTGFIYTVDSRILAPGNVFMEGRLGVDEELQMVEDDCEMY